jgi:hypothetical protein
MDFYVSYRYNILINIVLDSRLVYTVLNVDGARSVVGATTWSVTYLSHVLVFVFFLAYFLLDRDCD